MGYLDNWMKMLSGAQTVDPQGMAQPPPVAGKPAPVITSDPIEHPTSKTIREMADETGLSRTVGFQVFHPNPNYGRDIDLPAMGGPIMALYEQYKRMGYSDDQATKLAYMNANQVHGGARGALATKPRKE